MEQDKYFRQIVENHETPIDFDQLWDNLESHVLKKKRRRPVFIWFWVAGILLLGFSLFMVLDDSNNKQKTSYASSQVSKGTSEYDKEIFHENGLASKNVESSSIEHNDIVRNNKKSKNIINKNENIEDATNNINPRSNASITNQVQKNNIGITSTISSNSEALSVNNTDDIVKKIDLLNISTQNIKTVNTNIKESEVHETLLAPTVQMLKELPMIPPQINIIEVFFIPNIKLTDRKNNNILFHFGAGFYTINNTSQNSESGKSTSLNSSEKLLEYLTAGLSSDFKIAHRWYLQPGLKYSRYSSRVINEYNKYANTTKEGVTEIIINESGFVSNVQGSVDGTITTKIKSKWHSYHHSIDLPINIRYLLFNNYRHKFFIDGGPIVQLWSGSEGGYVDQSGQLQKYSLGDNPWRNNRLGWNGGIAWEWQISRYGGLHAGFTYDKRVMQRSEEAFRFDKSFSSYRMNLGYSIQF